MIWVYLAFGVFFGVVAERSDFCIHGIISEKWVLGTRTKLVGLLAFWAAFIIAFYPMAAVFAPELIPVVSVPIRASIVIGGLLLGYGMVLAGG